MARSSPRLTTASISMISASERDALFSVGFLRRFLSFNATTDATRTPRKSRAKTLVRSPGANRTALPVSAPRKGVARRNRKSRTPRGASNTATADPGAHRGLSAPVLGLYLHRP